MALRYRYLIADRSLTHDGIPACDLTDEDMAALTPGQRAVVAASTLYEDVKAATKGTAVVADKMIAIGDMTKEGDA